MFETAVSFAGAGKEDFLFCMEPWAVSYANVAVPLAHVRVPSQRTLAPNVTPTTTVG